MNPPSTKPSQSRRIRTIGAAPISSSQPVSFDDQVQRAIKRLERQIKVPPAVEQRWLERLADLATELDMTGAVGPTDEQVEIMIRELARAEEDVSAAQGDGPSPERAITSALSPIAARITAAARAPDVDGETTPRHEGHRPAARLTLVGGLDVAPDPAADVRERGGWT
jgi:hypothetical protein